MKKNRWKMAACSGASAALLMLAMNANAGDSGDGWRWRPGYTGTPLAAVEYHGQRIEDQNREQYRSVVAARDNLYASLNNQLYSRLQGALAGQSGYEWHTVAVRGPVDLNISPDNPANGPLVTLSGFSAELTTKFSKSFGPLKGSCTVTVNTGTLNLSGNLDVANGFLKNLKINNFAPSSNQDCSTNISWMPIIGQIVDSFANSKVDSLLSEGIRSAMTQSQETFAPIKFAGLNVAIPAGKYVYQSFDAGQYVVNNLSYLIASTNVQVHFVAPSPRRMYPVPYQSPQDPDGGNGRRVSQNDEVFSITFPNASTKFTVYEETNFNSYWDCKPMKPVCAPPDWQKK